MNFLFHRTMLALEQSFTCDLVASEIDYVGGVRLLSTSQNELLAFGIATGYSYVPLAAELNGPATLITHVAVLDPEKGTCDTTEVRLGRIIASSTPINKTISLLAEKPYYFVLSAKRLNKIITAADINKLPVRVYLYALIAHFEQLLADELEVRVPGDAWLANLREENQQRILEVQNRRLRNGLDTRLIDCVSLRDKLNICSTPTLEGLLPGLRSGIAGVNELREAVSHGHAVAQDREGVKLVAEAAEAVSWWIAHLAGQVEVASGGVRVTP